MDNKLPKVDKEYSPSSSTDNKIVPFLKKFWAIITLIFGGGIIAIIMRIKTLIDWISQMKFDLFHLPSTIKIILFCLFIIGVIIAIIYMKKKEPAPNIAVFFFLFAIVFGALLIVQKPEGFERIIIVYDSETPLYHSNVIEGIESQKLDDLKKLSMTGELNGNVLLISTVERPALRWSEKFPKGLALSNPVFSIQQVLEYRNSNFIDISFSNFEEDICRLIEEDIVETNDIRLFFEDEYDIAEKSIREYLISRKPSLNINTIRYNQNQERLLIDVESTIVFLGSPNTFKNFLKNVENYKYKYLIIPNWLRPNIIADSKISENHDCMRICPVSAVYDNLVSKDSETWHLLLTCIKQQSHIKDNEQLRNLIYGNFIKYNNPKIINF